MREKLYELIKPRSEETTYGKVYDICMIVVICLSLVPLMTKEQTIFLMHLDKITVSIFIIDYFLRWITADYIFKQDGVIPFIKYPFSLMAVLDLLSILPSLTLLYKGLKAVRVVRLIKALKVIKIAKSFRYSKNVEIVAEVLRKQRDSLIVVSFFAVGYVFVSAIVVFQAEPDTFETFLDAVYWATMSLTTIGYGDICVVTALGKIFAMLSSFVGISIIALPAGIITAGYMEEISKES